MKYKTWDYTGEFLNNFEQPRRSLISNMFCFAVRRGAKDALEVVRAVDYDALKRLNDDLDSDVSSSLTTLCFNLDTQEARNFAEFILWRESLSYEEKDRLKKEAGSQFSAQAMQGKAPTEKQIALLKKKGVKDIPTDRLEASKLIGELLKK